MISKTFAALAAFASTAFGTNPTGLHASLDIAVIEQAKDVYMQKIVETLNNLQLPDINSDDGKDYLHSNHVTVNQSTQDVQFSVDTAQNALKLTMNNLSANFYTDSFRAHSWIFVAKGHAEVDMKTVNIGLGLSFSTQTTADGKVVPAVSAVDVLVDINRNDISISIWGNIWADFASAFEIFFKSTVVGLIQDTVRDTLTTTIPNYLNAEFAAMDGNLLVPGTEFWNLDWQTPLAAVVTDTTFELGAKGIMYDSQIGESEWSTDFADMAYKDTAESAQFQVFLSDTSIDSLLGSYLEVGTIEGWLYGDQLPGSMNTTTVTAGLLDTALPGFAAKYGADTIVDIRGACTDLHGFASSAADQDVTVYGTANLQFWPRLSDGSTEIAVEMNLVDIKFTGGIDINNFMATGDISKFLVDKIDIVTSTIGSLSAFKLKVEFNTVSKLLVPELNKFISKYQVPIPSDIMGIFILSDLFLKYEDGYIFGGATPTFLPPAAKKEEMIASEVAQKLIQF